MRTNQEVINLINNLEGYEGYVQFSHRPIDKTKDIFFDGKKVEVKDEDGFLCEAHFCNGTQSIQIRQVNDSWLVSQTDITHIIDDDIETYKSDIKDWNFDIKMAQIWEIELDNLCDDMEVKKLKKVVFAGFVKGESK